MDSLRSFLALLLFQLAGAVLQTLLHLPLPAPVIGMALLAAWLAWRGEHRHRSLRRTSDGLLGWMGLLFVPAGVAVVANLTLLRTAWLPLSVGLVGSTGLTLLVTAGVMHWLRPRRAAGRAL